MSIAYSTCYNVSLKRKYVCVCVCKRERERNREREREKEGKIGRASMWCHGVWEKGQCVKSYSVTCTTYIPNLNTHSSKYAHACAHTHASPYSLSLSLAHSPPPHSHTHVPAFPCVRTRKFELGRCFWSWSRHSCAHSTILAWWSVSIWGGWAGVCVACSSQWQCLSLFHLLLLQENIHTSLRIDGKSIIHITHACAGEIRNFAGPRGTEQGSQVFHVFMYEAPLFREHVFPFFFQCQKEDKLCSCVT